MKKTAENITPTKSILFIESEPVWRDRLSNLPIGLFDVSIVQDYDHAINVILDLKKQYHVIVMNVDLNEVENDKKGFELARRIRKSSLFTQIVFLDRMDSKRRNEYARIIFGEIRGHAYIEKDMFDSAEFIETIHKSAEKAESEQKVVVLTPNANEQRNIFDEIVSPVLQEMGINGKRAGQNINYRAIERMENVRLDIRSAKFVISDLRYLEPNVYYETGIADAYLKNIILFARRNQIHEKMISLQQRIDIPESTSWKKTVKLELIEKIKQILNGDASNGSPNGLNSIDEDPIMCLALMPEDDDSQDTFHQLIHPVISRLNLNIIQVNNGGYQLPLERIRNSILKAHLIIVDLSHIDAFLCYCAGYAIGLNKKVMFITQDKNLIPDDFVEQDRVIYSKKIQSDRDKAKENLFMAVEDKMLSQISNRKGDSMKKIKVFINHASEDKPLAQKLYDELKKTSWIDPWLDNEKLLPGQDWELEINTALEASDAVLVCMSTVSVNKIGYVQAEIYKAEELQKRRPSGKIFKIPVLLEHCDVPADLKKNQWVDITIPGNIDLIVKSLETLR